MHQHIPWRFAIWNNKAYLSGALRPSPCRAFQECCLGNRDTRLSTAALGNHLVGLLQSLSQWPFCQGPSGGWRSPALGDGGGRPRAQLFSLLPLLLLSSSLTVAAFKNDKCVLILEHHSNNFFYFGGEKTWRKNSLGLNNHLSLQPSTLFMRFFIFPFPLRAPLASPLRHGLKLPLQRLYVYLQRASYEWASRSERVAPGNKHLPLS